MSLSEWCACWWTGNSLPSPCTQQTMQTRDGQNRWTYAMVRCNSDNRSFILWIRVLLRVRAGSEYWQFEMKVCIHQNKINPFIHGVVQAFRAFSGFLIYCRAGFDPLLFYSISQQWLKYYLGHIIKVCVCATSLISEFAVKIDGSDWHETTYKRQTNWGDWGGGFSFRSQILKVNISYLRDLLL